MTPADYPALLAESYDEPAFSNGDEGRGFMWANCDRCIHDKPAREHDYRNGCPLILITLDDRRPKQFINGPRDAEGRYSREQQWICTEFRSEDDPDPNPTPIPDPPGQDALFDRDGFTGVRMLTALPQQTEVGSRG